VATKNRPVGILGRYTIGTSGNAVGQPRLNFDSAGRVSIEGSVLFDEETMAKTLPSAGRWARGILGLMGLALLVSACEGPIAAKRDRPAPSTASPPVSKPVPAPPPPALPRLTVQLDNVRIDWRDRQQLFTLTFTNQGDRDETAKAIVYAQNNSFSPPRRAVSPPTAYQWFELAKSKDGRLTRQDIEQHWGTLGAFISARGVKMPSAWTAILKPKETRTLDCSHDLPAVSPHPLWKDRPLPRVGYNEYHLWLFTLDGKCYLEQRIFLQGNQITEVVVNELTPEANAPADKPPPPADKTDKPPPAKDRAAPANRTDPPPPAKDRPGPADKPASPPTPDKPAQSKPPAGATR
jgi:hypothetical protein